MKDFFALLLNALLLPLTWLDKLTKKIAPSFNVSDIKFKIDGFVWVLLAAVFLTGGISPLFYWSMLYLFVMIHELAHTVVARALGYQTPQIVLQPMGAAVQILNLGQDPKDEFYIALAGPVSNFVLAIILLTCNFTGSGIITNLVALNLLLGLFNLIPVYPMDGGRILRSCARLFFPAACPVLLTKRVVNIGRVVFIGLLFLTAIFTPWFNFIWLLILGAFVWFMGDAEVKMIEEQQRAKDLAAFEELWKKWKRPTP